jgi:hypothetical protein
LLVIEEIPGTSKTTGRDAIGGKGVGSIKNYFRISVKNELLKFNRIVLDYDFPYMATRITGDS